MTHVSDFTAFALVVGVTHVRDFTALFACRSGARAEVMRCVGLACGRD